MLVRRHQRHDDMEELDAHSGMLPRCFPYQQLRASSSAPQSAARSAVFPHAPREAAARRCHPAISVDGDCGSLHLLRGARSTMAPLPQPNTNPTRRVTRLTPLPEHARPRFALARQPPAAPADTAHPVDTLTALPLELALAVLEQLRPLDAATLSCTCRAMAAVTAYLRAASGKVLSMLPSPSSAAPAALGAPLDSGAFPQLRKNDRPGFGTFVGAELANAYNCQFEVRLDNFTGVNLEVGLAPASAFASGGLEKSRAWLFDCWGRKAHGGRREAYGGKLRTGDRLGVLFNYAAQSLSFLLNGVSMGVCFTGVTCLGPGGKVQPLYPVVSIPHVPGEAVTLLEPSPNCRDLLALEASATSWACPPHPDDNKLVVETMWYSTFRLPVDLRGLTVASLKEVMAGVTSWAPEHLSVYVDGRHYADHKRLDADCQISFGANHTHVPHVLLSIVQAVS
mmetsp:Transcript_45638/g.116794  ORF Transcript_45638/g.116794 Transcript_45638/m.116794 type:complete len:453 (+) Transcript_45638:52-1410(+)|eukprot:jgi/Tetstr1/465717/TSEL_010342.t1